MYNASRYHQTRVYDRNIDKIIQGQDICYNIDILVSGKQRLFNFIADFTELLFDFTTIIFY